MQVAERMTVSDQERNDVAPRTRRHPSNLSFVCVRDELYTGRPLAFCHEIPPEICRTIEEVGRSKAYAVSAASATAVSKVGISIGAG